LHSGVWIARIALLCAVVVAAGVALVSGSSDSDPRTPTALPSLPPPFLGTAVTGNGGMTAAIDAYGDVVDLRPGPAGAALIDNPSARQAAGTVPEDTGIVPRLRIGDGPARALWEADSVTQRYLPSTNVVLTVGRFGGARLIVTTAATGDYLAMEARVRTGGWRQRFGGSRPADAGSGSPAAVPSVSVDVVDGVRCASGRRGERLDLICEPGRDAPPVSGAAVRSALAGSATEAGHWLARTKPLGSGAPAWAREMYERSLLSIHALTSRRTGAVAAGARDGWAYVWPRDAATAALALEASGHRDEARRVTRFLTGLDLGAAARFDETGAPIPGRAAQGDAAGWATVAAEATGIRPPPPLPWRDRADYQESTPGTYLGNALAATVTHPQHPHVDGPKTGDIGGFSARQHRVVGEGARIGDEFGSEGALERVAGDPGSGLDSAAGWAVRPFRVAGLDGAAERTLRRLLAAATPYGITPGEGWQGGDDPWMAPTAWSAWAFAGLAMEGRVGDRRRALALLQDLRRASTPAGAIPERVDLHTGVPTSTTPLVWPSAFAVLTIRELWP
jgi:glucoamylase